jgi:D-glycero-D-manno-heptose 1,7-bisphosphate phosphatase
MFSAKGSVPKDQSVSQSNKTSQAGAGADTPASDATGAGPLSIRRPALFLDRDGVINEDHSYVHTIDAFEWCDGIFDLVRAAVACGYQPVVITNQSGIGRGYYSEAHYDALTAWMCKRFAAEGAPVTRVYHCPYHPEAIVAAYRQNHPWRKPSPGMLLQAQRDLDIDLTASILVGDTWTDIAAADAAGVPRTVFIGPGAIPDGAPRPSHRAPDLRAALDWLQLQFQLGDPAVTRNK